MTKNELVTNVELISSGQRIQRFLQRVWNHPLVNDDLITHRQHAFTLLKSFLDVNRSYSEFVFIPVGSMLWSIDSSTSDYDFVCIVPDYLANMHANNDINLKAARRKEKLHILPTTVPLAKASVTDHRDAVFNLLLHPDSHIMGNVELATEIRKKICISDAESINQYPKIWMQNYRYFFAKYYSGWPMLSYEPKGAEKKRGERFELALKDRSEKSCNPKKYRTAFIRSLINTPDLIPELKIYQDFYSITNGAMSFTL